MQVSFARFDDALMERLFQPVADLVTYRTCLDRLHIAGFCLDAAAVAWILSQAGALTLAVTQWEVGAALPRMLLLVLGLVALTSL